MFIVNDLAILNDRYRSNLIKSLRKSNIGVVSIGIFDGYWSFVSVLIIFIFKSKSVISSNLKVNLIFLIFLWSQGLMIVNGLGRLGQYKLFRRSFGLLLCVNIRKKILIQNYLDFRYYRRFYRANISWMPGSGGRHLKYGKQNNHVIISRPLKLRLQINSLYEAVQNVPSKNAIILVGVDRFEDDLSDLGILFCGFVEQKNIFLHGNSYIQLSGYGEGMPHVLVDALVSGVEVHLTKKDFIQYGLFKLGFRFERTNTNWGICVSNNQNKSVKIGYEEVAEQVLSHLVILKNHL